jgi:hypothetical protein
MDQSAQENRREIMKTKNPIWFIIIFIMLVSIACGSSASSTPTPTSVFVARPVIVGSGGNAGSGAGGSAGSGSGSGSGGGVKVINTPVSTPPPTPVPTPSHTTGPYNVVQIVKLGDETITGFVCDQTKQFSVNVSTPKIQFVIYFTPTISDQGTLAYSYNFPALGESHDATGSYTITGPGNDGSLLVNFSSKDHVVFKGFDGIIPLTDKFNLVPAQIPNCP